MNNMTLRQLGYFDALARHSHFGHAAAACAISQPALSMQIKELEGVLGAVLFERGARQVRLTKFGKKRRCASATSCARSMNSADSRSEHRRTGSTGRLRIGMIPTIAPYLLPMVIGDLTRNDPELDIYVREALTSKLIDELAGADLTLRSWLFRSPSRRLPRLLCSGENFCWSCRANEGKPAPGSKTLREMKLLLLEEGHCFRDQALLFCNMKSSPQREMLDASSLSTLVQMVGAGMGVTLIPEMAVAVETRSASVSLARFKNPQPSRTIGMIWRKTSPLAGQLLPLSEIVCRSGDALLGRRHPKIAAVP